MSVIKNTAIDISNGRSLTQLPGWPVVGTRESRLLRMGEWVLLACLIVLFLIGGFLRGWRSLRSEFPNYYLASLLHRRGDPLERAYEWTWFQRQNDELGVYHGKVSFAPNPPSSLLPILPLASLPPLSGKRVWLSMNVIFLIASLWILRRVTSLGWRRLGLIAFLCIIPLRFTFLYGRYYVLILLLLSAAYYAAHRGRELTSGLLLAAAAALKLFPGLFLLLLLWKKNWRAVAGFLIGAAVFLTISLFTFGLEVHRLFFDEVLSQIGRGDWLGPYELSRNTFITLWSHLFLLEPDLNAAPFINSPTLYAVAQAATATLLTFALLRSVDRDNRPQSRALEWAAMIPLTLLLSTTTGADHSCVLIASAVIGYDALLRGYKQARALTLLLLCAAVWVPIPESVLGRFPLVRLLALTSFYLLTLQALRAGHNSPMRFRWLVPLTACFALLVILNLRTVRNRSEDFDRRLPMSADNYRASGPSAIPGGVAFVEMNPRGYRAAIVKNAREFDELPSSGDVLAVAGAEDHAQLYLELAGRQPLIARLPLARLDAAPQNFMVGQEPVVSSNGKWLAFIREESGRSTLWLVPADSTAPPQMVLPESYHAIEATVNAEGDLIAAVGKVSDPRLLWVRRVTKAVEPLSGYGNPARYPAISPDGRRLAFSQREYGFWHLTVRNLSTGSDEKLTHAECNATTPSWQNSETLVYATDCGRGVGLSALARIVVPE